MLLTTINKLPIGTLKVAEQFQGSIKTKLTVLSHLLRKSLWTLLLWIMLIYSAQDVFSKTKHYLDDLFIIKKKIYMNVKQERASITQKLNNNEVIETTVLIKNIEKMHLATERAI